MLAPSLSRRPFESNDISDGEIYPLTSDSPLWGPLMTENWLNWPQDMQQMWQHKMRHSDLRFLGYMLSPSRQQVEVTLVYPPSATSAGGIEHAVVTLRDFNRFISLC